MASASNGTEGQSTRPISLRMCWLFAANLAVLTVGVLFDYSSEEPFPIFMMRSQAEEAYEMHRALYTFTYLWVGTLALLGWTALGGYLLQRLIRGPRPVHAWALLVATLLAIWVSSWTPREYLEDLDRIDHPTQAPPGRGPR